MKSSACFALLLAVLGASCGGNVLVDPGGSTSTNTAGACITACQAVVAACPGKGPPTDCMTSCQKLDPLFEAACPDVYDAYMTCLAANAAAVCNTAGPMACVSEVQAFSSCSAQVCNPASVCM